MIFRASKGHTGSYLAARISECLHEYGIQDKVSVYSCTKVAKLTLRPQILAFTADNTSNNNTLIDELGDLLDGFQGSLTRVRCFAHILNLMVKVCITQTCTFPFSNCTPLVYPFAVQPQNKSYKRYSRRGWRCCCIRWTWWWAGWGRNNRECWSGGYWRWDWPIHGREQCCHCWCNCCRGWRGIRFTHTDSCRSKPWQVCRDKGKYNLVSMLQNVANWCINSTSYETSLNEYSTVPQSMLILRVPALRVKLSLSWWCEMSQHDGTALLNF